MRLLAVLASLAAAALAVLVAEVVILGMPRLWTVVGTSMLIGLAAGWPLAQRPPDAGVPSCRDCGYPSWMSVEFRFCIHCGSHRVWRAD